MALTNFFAEGHFARHLRRMRMCYTARLQTLITAAKSICSDLLEIQVPAAGMHVTGWLPPGVADIEIEQRAARQGIEVVALSTMSKQPLPRGGLVLGFAACSEQDIEVGVRILARVLRE